MYTRCRKPGGRLSPVHTVGGFFLLSFVVLFFYTKNIIQTEVIQSRKKSKHVIISERNRGRVSVRGHGWEPCLRVGGPTFYRDFALLL